MFILHPEDSCLCYELQSYEIFFTYAIPACRFLRRLPFLCKIFTQTTFSCKTFYAEFPTVDEMSIIGNASCYILLSELTVFKKLPQLLQKDLENTKCLAYLCSGFWFWRLKKVQNFNTKIPKCDFFEFLVNLGLFLTQIDRILRLDTFKNLPNYALYSSDYHSKLQ